MRNFSSQFILLYLAVFINIVAFSMVFPLLPLYARTFEASNLTIGLLAACFALAQFIFAPLWGILSDRFGRKAIIAGGLMGITGSFFLFGAATSIFVLFMARFLQGIFSAATLPAARAYIADITTNEERVRALGRLGAALSLGVILGPAIGGIFAKTSLSLPFFAAGVVAFLNLLFVIKFLPESLTERTTQAVIVGRGFLLQNIKRVWRGLRAELGPLFILSFLWSFVLSNNQVAVPLLELDKFHLGPADVGILFAVMGAVSAFVQIFLLVRITNFLGKHLSITLGLILMGLGFLAMPFVPTSLAFLYGAVAVAALGSSMTRPVITALISEETTEGQGVTMGTATAFESMGRLVGPLLGGFLFAYGAATPFVFSTFVIAITLLFILKKTPFLSWRHRT